MFKKGKTKGIVLTAVILCGAVKAASAEELTKHANVDFATGSPSGGWYPIGAQIAEITNQHFEGNPVSVLPGGGTGNVARVGNSQADLGISYAPFLRQGFNGEGEYDKELNNLRAIAGLIPTLLHLIAKPSSGIENTEELVEKESNIASGVPGSAEFLTLDYIYSYYGKNLRDNPGNIRSMQTQGRVDAWQDNRVEAVNMFLNVPASAVNQMLSTGGASWVKIEEDLQKELISEHGYLAYNLPENTYPSQPEAVQTVGLPMVVFGSGQLDDEFVYLLTKSIAENKERLESTHAGFSSWDPEDMVNGLGIELHPGAKRYYVERGWID